MRGVDTPLTKRVSPIIEKPRFPVSFNKRDNRLKIGVTNNVWCMDANIITVDIVPGWTRLCEGMLVGDWIVAALIKRVASNDSPHSQCSAFD